MRNARWAVAMQRALAIHGATRAATDGAVVRQNWSKLMAELRPCHLTDICVV